MGKRKATIEGATTRRAKIVPPVHEKVVMKKLEEDIKKQTSFWMMSQKSGWENFSKVFVHMVNI